MRQRRRYTREEQQEWVRRWRQSGVSAVEFAAEHALSKATLYGWAQRYSGSPESGAAFTEVRLRHPRSSEAGTMEIVLGGGRVVRVRGAVESRHLRQVLEALKAC